LALELHRHGYDDRAEVHVLPVDGFSTAPERSVIEGQTVEERAARGARSQSLFRDVNERVKEINRAFSSVLPLGDWICECADASCTPERIFVSPAAYEAVRADPARFAVAPSDPHVFSEIEDVVGRNERYWVVEKKGQGAELATKVDPRRVGLRGSVQNERSQ
jgi:hypothetical protein